VIATRQHALGVLFHDAAHFRLFSNRWVNDFVGNVFCALPGSIILSRYRAEHLKHHVSPNSERDPYWRTFQTNPECWAWPKRRWAGVWVICRDALGLNLKTALQEFGNWFPWRRHFAAEAYPVPLSRSDRFITYAFFSTVLLLVWRVIGIYNFIVLWMVPLCTVAQALFRLRAIAEHFAVPVSSPRDATRDIKAHFLECLSISPLNINYHLTHHLFPSIPHYNLREMSEILHNFAGSKLEGHYANGYVTPSGVFFGSLAVH